MACTACNLAPVISLAAPASRSQSTSCWRLAQVGNHIRWQISNYHLTSASETGTSAPMSQLWPTSASASAREQNGSASGSGTGPKHHPSMWLHLSTCLERSSSSGTCVNCRRADNCNSATSAIGQRFELAECNRAIGLANRK